MNMDEAAYQADLEDRLALQTVVSDIATQEQWFTVRLVLTLLEANRSLIDPATFEDLWFGLHTLMEDFGESAELQMSLRSYYTLVSVAKRLSVKTQS